MCPSVIASIMWTPRDRALLIWLTMVLGLLKSAVNVNGVVVDALPIRRYGPNGSPEPPTGSARGRAPRR